MEAIVREPKHTRYDALLSYARAARKHYQSNPVEYAKNEQSIEDWEWKAVKELTSIMVELKREDTNVRCNHCGRWVDFRDTQAVDYEDCNGAAFATLCPECFAELTRRAR